MKFIAPLLAILFSFTSMAQPFKPNSYDTTNDAQVKILIGQQIAGSNYITGNVRQELTNAFTWFVATTGNDSNPGTNVAAPLLTIQAGVDKALATDFGTNTATVQIADGRYEGTVVIKSTASTAAWQNKGGFLVLHGNDASPTSVILTNSATNHLVVAAYGAKAILASMYLTSTNRNNECLIDSQMFSYVGFSNVTLGACGATEAQLVAEASGVIESLGAYTVNGGGNAHALALGNGTIYLETSATFSGTPSYTNSVFRAYNGGAIFAVGPFSGAVTGPRFNLATGGSISRNGAGAIDAIPGSTTGTMNLSTGEGATNYSSLGTTMIMTNILGTNGDVDSIRFEKYGNDVNGPSVSSFHSRGTTGGSQSAVTTDDRLFFLGGGGSDGSVFQTNKAMMSFNAESPWAAASNATYILFQTTSPNVTLRSNSFRINGDHTIATFGFNTLAPGNITVGASPLTYTTSSGHSEFVYINGGAVSSVTLNGTQVASGTNTCITVNLQNGESAVITYSVAPLSIKRKPY